MNELPKITDIIAKYATYLNQIEEGTAFTIPYKDLHKAFKEYGIGVRDTTLDITSKENLTPDFAGFIHPNQILILKQDKRLEI